MDAPWDERNDRLTEVLRWSARNPAQAEAEIRHLLEQGININARDENRWRALRLATYFQAPMHIRNMLKFASKEGSAPVSTPSGDVADHVCSIANVPADRSGCGQCKQDVHAIFHCPERSSGHCPFVEREARYINIFTNPSLVVIVIVAAPLLVLIIGKSTWVWWWVALSCVVSALILWAITREKLLYNTQSYVWLQHTTVANIEWSYRWSWELGMPIYLEQIPSLTYPLSISSLSVIHSTTALTITPFRAALMELLAKQNIAAYLFRSYAATSERPIPAFVEAYVALVERHAKGFENLGALEKQLFLAVRSCSNQRAVQPLYKDSMAGLRLYEVVRAVYQHDVFDPKSWLADLVTNDAIERGVAYITRRWLWEKVEWSSDHLSKLRDERAIALSLSGKLRTMFPEFSCLIDAEIESAISSRVKESGGGGG